MATRLDGIGIDIGPVSLGVVDDAGVEWHVQTLSGWDSAEVRADLTQREADHGAWLSPVYLGERPVTVEGTIFAPDGPALDAATEQLLAAVALTDTLMTVHETIPKQCLVRRSGKPVITRVTDQVATYSLLVTAGDPRRYAVDLGSISAGLPSTTGGLVLPA
ncbi:phage distal tail protein, partial [Streptomyces sp. NPDC002920]